MDKLQENTTETSDTPKGAFPAVPTTKILAIGQFLASVTPEQRKPILPREVPDTVRLHLGGKIDQWWSRQDGKGPVFLMNVTSLEEARALLATLPFGQAKLMEFDLIELVHLARSTCSSPKAGRQIALLCEWAQKNSGILKGS